MPVPQSERQPGSVQRGPRILREGVIEGLVAEGRTPQLSEMYQGSRKLIVCYVPPEGTQIGDTQIWVNGYGPGYRSPSGEFRGKAIDMGQLTPSQVRQVVERIEVARTLRQR